MRFKIKKYQAYILACSLFFIWFLFFVRTHPLSTQFQIIPRTSVPIITAPAGTFSLVTEPEQGTAEVLDLIKNASKSVDVVMYEFKDKQIADALIAAARRGVAVRALLNQGYYGKEEAMNEPAYSYLESNGVLVHWTPDYFALTHQKTLIIDGTQALIMTFNFTPQYYATGRDFGVLNKDTKDVGAIEDAFNNDWQNRNSLASDADDLVWSPYATNDMLLAINSAKKELDIYNEEMEDPDIIDALSEAARRGISVNVIMTYETSWKVAFQELKDSGVELHLFHGEKGLYIHAKMILVDQSYTFLGSQNFSYTSLNKNRELGIFLSDPTIITSLYKTFATDWKNARPF